MSGRRTSAASALAPKGTVDPQGRDSTGGIAAAAGLPANLHRLGICPLPTRRRKAGGGGGGGGGPGLWRFLRRFPSLDPVPPWLRRSLAPRPPPPALELARGAAGGRQRPELRAASRRRRPRRGRGYGPCGGDPLGPCRPGPFAVLAGSVPVDPPEAAGVASGACGASVPQGLALVALLVAAAVTARGVRRATGEKFLRPGPCARRLRAALRRLAWRVGTCWGSGRTCLSPEFRRARGVSLWLLLASTTGWPNQAEALCSPGSYNASTGK